MTPGSSLESAQHVAVSMDWFLVGDLMKTERTVVACT